MTPYSATFGDNWLQWCIPQAVHSQGPWQVRGAEWVQTKYQKGPGLVQGWVQDQ
jgi:hypothetical protein